MSGPIFDEVHLFSETGRLLPLDPRVLDPAVEPELFDPPTEPDASRPLPVRREPVIVDRPGRQCKNAGTDPAHLKRPAPHPGPRCASCKTAKERADRASAADLHVLRRFRMSPEQYDALYELQGRRCYICRIASGKRKRLAVDHDHTLAMAHGHPVDEGCELCWRGLACGPCNQEVLGRLGGNPETFQRIADDLRDPPAQRMRRMVP